MHRCRLGDQGRPEACRARGGAARIEDKRVSTPGVSGIEEEDEEGDVPLMREDITRYRGVIAHCNYMAADRPDFVFAIKEGCREMSKPRLAPQVLEDASQTCLEVCHAGRGG